MSKIEIQNPLNKVAYKTFLSQYIQIHFFKKEEDETRALENLKNMLFPPKHTDQLFNELVNFVKTVMDKLILSSTPLDKIKAELNESVKNFSI